MPPFENLWAPCKTAIDACDLCGLLGPVHLPLHKRLEAAYQFFAWNMRKLADLQQNPCDLSLFFCFCDDVLRYRHLMHRVHANRITHSEYAKIYKSIGCVYSSAEPYASGIQSGLRGWLRQQLPSSE